MIGPYSLRKVPPTLKTIGMPSFEPLFQATGHLWLNVLRPGLPPDVDGLARIKIMYPDANRPVGF